MSDLPASAVDHRSTRRIRLETVAYDDPRAVALRRILDVDLDARYGGGSVGEPPETTAARSAALRVLPEQLMATWLAFDDDGVAVGHVILRRLGEDLELKRLIVAPDARGRGIARTLVGTTVDHARELGARRLILQTGAAQPESVALYRSIGFTAIPVYEPYVATMPQSLCFELPL